MEEANTSSTQATRLGRAWLLKMVVFFVAGLGVGLWGLVDATWKYPERGRADASYKLMTYLEAAQQARMVTARQVRVENPHQELERLTQTAGEAPGSMTAVDQAKLGWLRSLSSIGRVDDAATMISPDAPPRELLDRLRTEWTSRNPPKALAAYDIPVQWAITAVGVGVALVVGLHLLRVSRRVYRYEPATGTLTLPGGRTIRPQDVAEFDKRAWHKFLVTLVLGDGKKVTLDLYRHTPLEQWVLEMERVRFPDAAKEGGADGEAADGPTGDAEAPAPSAEEASARE